MNGRPHLQGVSPIWKLAFGASFWGHVCTGKIPKLWTNLIRAELHAYMFVVWVPLDWCCWEEMSEINMVSIGIFYLNVLVFAKVKIWFFHQSKNFNQQLTNASQFESNIWWFSTKILDFLKYQVKFFCKKFWRQLFWNSVWYSHINCRWQYFVVTFSIYKVLLSIHT